MFTDPIVLTPTLASILPSNGGYSEQTFRLLSQSGEASSVRAPAVVEGGVNSTLTIRQATSAENKSLGLITDRVNVRIDLRAPVSDEDSREAIGSVSVVIALPRGTFYLTADAVVAALSQLAQLLLTSTDDPTANTAMTVSSARILRLLAGEG